MREVEVYDTSGTNVALNMPATQSSLMQDNQGWGPSKGVDGLFNNLMQTAWQQGECTYNSSSARKPHSDFN